MQKKTDQHTKEVIAPIGTAITHQLICDTCREEFEVTIIHEMSGEGKMNCPRCGTEISWTIRSERFAE